MTDTSTAETTPETATETAAEPAALDLATTSDLADEFVWQIREGAKRSEFMAMTQGLKRSGRNAKACEASVVWACCLVLADVLHGKPNPISCLIGVSQLIAGMQGELAVRDAQVAAG